MLERSFIEKVLFRGRMSRTNQRTNTKRAPPVVEQAHPIKKYLVALKLNT